MASLLDFFMTPSGGLLSGNVGPAMPRASGLLDAPGFGSAPASDSTLTRLREWAGQQLNPASLADFPSPQGFSAPSFAQPMEPNPYIRAAASFVPVLGDALDIADVGRRAMNDPASLSGWDALSMLPMVPLATAWHGSPHRFDKFSLEHIGSGEGAQVYGHGLYFAESPHAAGYYAEKLAGSPIGPQSPHDFIIDGAHYKLGPNKQRLRKVGSGPYLEITADEYAAALRRAGDAWDNRPKGVLYKVDIPDEAVARFLDWDAPLSEQPAAVREALESLGDKGALAKSSAKYGQVDPTKEVTGGDFLKALNAHFGGDKAASEALRNAGIPGIKYFDGNSRAAGEGTRNFVLFDDDLVTILERNGETMP